MKNLKDFFKYVADLSVGYLAYSPEYNLFKNLKKKPAYEKIMLLLDDKIGDFLRKNIIFDFIFGFFQKLAHA